MTRLPDFPIRIELNAFATSGYQDLLDFAANEWDTRYNFPKADARDGQILAEIANEQSLLKEQAKGWQGFLHLTLQEYFVAQYVTDHQLLDILLAYRGEPWWEEVLLLYAGYSPDASPLLHKLLESDEQGRLKDDIFYTNLC